MFVKTHNPPALILMVPACPTLCDSLAAMACTPAMSLSFARRTAASACRREWRGTFLKTRQTTPRRSFGNKRSPPRDWAADEGTPRHVDPGADYSQPPLSQRAGIDVTVHA